MSPKEDKNRKIEATKFDGDKKKKVGKGGNGRREVSSKK